MDVSGLLWSKDRVYVPDRGDIRYRILIEFHRVPHSGHTGYRNMIYAVKKHFFWPNLKADIAMFIAKCQEFHLVKVEHQHPVGLLQPLPIPGWKWEVISMEFLTGLPKSKKKNDYTFEVIDKLSKAAHFIPVKLIYKAVNISDIFLKEIFRLHGIPKVIVSD